MATCWLIEPRDQTSFRLTDHDQELRIDEDGDGDTELYEPAGGPGATADQRDAGLKTQTIDLLGVITSDVLTEDDLRAGRFRGAKITRFLVDWFVPWAGVFEKQSFWVADIKFNGETWNLELSSTPIWLQQKVGRYYTRTCDVRELGDSRCGAAISGSPYTISNVGVENGSQDTDEPRRVFNGDAGSIPSSDNGVTVEDGFFKHGKVVWTSGANADAGHTSEIKEYTHTDRVIELYLPTPYDIADSDEFTLIVGCDRLGSTCSTKFDNRVNFKGFSRIPGSDKVLRTPKRVGS